MLGFGEEGRRRVFSKSSSEGETAWSCSYNEDIVDQVDVSHFEREREREIGKVEDWKRKDEVEERRKRLTDCLDM